MELTTILTTIALGIGFSLSHCIGMCGGFVAACNLKLSKTDRITHFILSLGYHLSRVLAYVILGILFGLFGSAVIFSGFSKGLFIFFAGVILIILSFAIFKRGRLLSCIENQKIISFIMSLLSKFRQKNSTISLLILGFLNGLLPCGVVYYFLAISFGSGSIIEGAAIMAIFGLSTIPVMMGFGGILSAIGAKFKNYINLVSFFIMLGYGMYLLYLGFMVLK
ncbi:MULTISPECIES: sulfite exporter TauE/SafE family protein [Campylobacter]|uniref:sulfite exporter TauE/SafE family protein n=1 Tax=Campylobacter TaxID=194 RepID=UPI000A3333BB|nr:sulfite exporter TauE/SafE family protein [Campylobacter sp. P0024]MCR8679056.1 sulfite exporter TauE/SafE family protein [Campylobacter sp. RM19072]